MKPTKKQPRGKVKRFVFNIEKDIQLLRKCLEFNPWQLGNEKWNDISNSVSELFGTELKVRTAKERVENLLMQYEKQEFTVKTGTEEEKSERGELLEEIRALKEQVAMPINTQFGAENNFETSSQQVFTIDEVNDAVGTSSSATQKQENLDSKRAFAEEQKQADKERDVLLKYASDVPPEPDLYRRKRTRVTIEEDLILKKQQHDMDIEAKKLKLQEEVKLKELDNEKQKLEIERMREERLADEGRRRDELMITMCSLLSSFRKPGQ